MATLYRRRIHFAARPLRGAVVGGGRSRAGRGGGARARRRYALRRHVATIFFSRCTYGILCRNCNCLDGEDISGWWRGERRLMTFSAYRVTAGDNARSSVERATLPTRCGIRAHVSTDYESRRNPRGPLIPACLTNLALDTRSHALTYINRQAKRPELHNTQPIQHYIVTFIRMLQNESYYDGLPPMAPFQVSQFLRNRTPQGGIR